MWLSRKSGRSFRSDLSVGAMRAGAADATRRYGMKDPGGVDVRELTIPAGGDGTEAGAATIAARLYRRADTGDGALPVLLYFHGGGGVILDVASYDTLTRYFAHEARIAVLSVDYRLGPEYRFPRGHEDAFAALGWLQANAPALGLDAQRIAVGGDSAGGNLAASLCAYAESRGLARPVFAFLIYPWVDGGRGDGENRFASQTAYDGDLPLTTDSIAWYWKHFSNGAEDRSQPLLGPLDAPRPERHPPAYILAAQYDPLVDEGRAYFERLRDAGVPVAYDLRATLPHGFVNLAGVLPEARRALAAGIRATAVALGTRPPQVAALTGAASGIGRALAIELARHGYLLALADRDEAGLAQTAALVRDRTGATTHRLDVADKAAVDAFAAAVLRAHGRVDVLVNNAGVSLAGDVAELAVDEIAWLMDINFWGTVYGVKAFLPALERSGGTVVNLSSVFGLIGPPGQSAYAASKFAVRGFSESLREEVRGRGVHVLTVHPGGIKTSIARTARIAAGADQELARRRMAAFDARMLTQSPEKAARLIVRGILRGKERVLIGSDAVRIDVLARLLGPGAARVFGRLALRALPGDKRRAGK